MKLIRVLTFSSLMLFLASSVQAYGARDFLLKFGVVNMSHQSDTGVDDLEVKDDTQAALALTLMLTRRLGIEYTSSTAYKYQVFQGEEKLGSVRSFSPTVSFQYYLMEPYYYIQPYVGVGLNHTFFFTEDGKVRNLGKSTGIALSAGINTEITESVFTSFALWKMDVKSEFTQDEQEGASPELKLNSLMLFAGIGVRF